MMLPCRCPSSSRLLKPFLKSHNFFIIFVWDKSPGIKSLSVIKCLACKSHLRQSGEQRSSRERMSFWLGEQTSGNTTFRNKSLESKSHQACWKARRKPDGLSLVIEVCISINQVQQFGTSVMNYWTGKLWMAHLSLQIIGCPDTIFKWNKFCPHFGQFQNIITLLLW